MKLLPYLSENVFEVHIALSILCPFLPSESRLSHDLHSNDRGQLLWTISNRSPRGLLPQCRWGQSVRSRLSQSSPDTNGNYLRLPAYYRRSRFAECDSDVGRLLAPSSKSPLPSSENKKDYLALEYLSCQNAASPWFNFACKQNSWEARPPVETQT